ncbi:MAG: chromosome segregation protein SMC [Saccharofermentanales bacterium]|jgi:chromosome segregation protein
MLKSLEMQGFKSFPERTEIMFHKGVTAIVGPNGAGKSNITDAIRWVLGEQSAKTLRGRRMEDVIFGGTAQRRPVSFCEVTLTFDNADGMLPIDYETVAITRRYYRSGESEYLINKTPCRLKDINALLMDTGIGRDGYSIVGQGRVDEILSTRSEDRRAVFEEASGIVQFRARKDEALRKLERSANDLVRVDDVLAELNHRRGPLEHQAEAARSHGELARRFRFVDTSLMIRQIEKLELQRAKREDDAVLMSKDLEQARHALTEARTAYEAAVDGVETYDRQIEHAREQYNDLSVAETEMRGLEALYHEKLDGAKTGAEALLEERNRLMVQRMAMEQDSEKQAARRAELVAQRDEARKNLEEAREAWNAAVRSLDEHSRDVAHVEAERERWRRKHSDAVAGKESVAGERRARTAREDALRQERDRLEDDVRTRRAHYDDVVEKRAEEARLIERLTVEAEAANRRTGEGHGLVDAADREVESTLRAIEQMSYEVETLERLEASFEGFRRPVQRLMAHATKDGAPGIYGPLGQLIDVEPRYAQALETALGASTHHIVCDGPETATTWIDWLRETRSGRVTFLPLSDLNVRTLDPSTRQKAERAAGWVGVASELVTCDAAVTAAVTYAVGRTLIVETLDDAIALSRTLRRSHTIVSLDGDVVYRGGSMAGGSTSDRTTGVIGRSAQIRTLKSKIDTHRATLEQRERALADAKDQLQGWADQEAAILERRADAKSRYIRLEAAEQADKEALERVEHQWRERVEEAEANARRLAELDDDLARFERQQAEADAAIARLDADMEGMMKTRGERTRVRDDVRDRLTMYEVTSASLDASLEEFDTQVQSATDAYETAGLRLTSIEREWKDQDRRIVEAREAIERNERDLIATRQAREACRQEIERLTERRETSVSTQRTQLAAMNDQNDRVTTLAAAYERVSVERQRVGDQIDQQLNRLWETHGLTRPEAEAELATMEPIQSMAKASQERAELVAKIEALGPINHNAVDEYEALVERIEFTTEQREDIERAKEDLESVIRDLDQSMRERFNETFHQINENFGEVFHELFSGGHAEIMLEGDEDPLAADIAIRAQPPGKKLQRLTLLSGGERCLTAIALLFAILKLKPAPFCVFDEVESALDDANVKRFTDYVRRYAWSMQFILVTHRKGTMEASDRLYGVTMQERGISSVLSMKLSSALPFGT